MKKFAIIVSIAILFAGPYFLMNKESKVLNDDARDSLPGSFVSLPQGVVHYEMGGLKEGVPVILIHGFSVPSVIWDPVYSSLVNANYRVLRYDLFGRGLSDRPDEPNNVMFFRKQLEDLLYSLDIEGKVNLVALSMGGAIAVDFANEHPDKVASLSLMAPAGYPVNVPIVGQVARLPIIGDYLMRSFGGVNLKAALMKAFYNQDKAEAFWPSYLEQMQYKGFSRSILSTLRNYPVGSMYEIYESVGTKNIPTLLLWGKEDLIIPFKNNELVRKAIPHARFYGFDSVGHVPSYEVPDKVIPLLLEFLENKPENITDQKGAK